MKIVLHIALLCALAATPAAAWNINNIGLYSTPTPSRPWSDWVDEERILRATAPGVYDVHLVCFNPYDLEAHAAIELVGGFELAVTMPLSWIIFESTLPASFIDFDNTPEGFLCVGALPAGDGPLLLATLRFLSFSAASGPVFLTPLPVMPSLEGHMAIANGGREGALSPAFPSSGDYGIPVFGINLDYVSNESTAWGNLKAIYR